MRIFSWATVVAAVLFVPSLAAAQQARPAATASAGANATRYGVAVVDVSYVFKHHQRFNTLMDQMKADVEAAEKALRQERQEIAKMEEALQQFQPGSPDYKRRDEGITEAKAAFNLKATKQRKDFLEREAKIYYQAYVEVNDAVKYFAQRSNLGLVLRFNGEPVDPNIREDVLRAINKPVVFQNGIDITPDILALVNRSAASAKRPSGPQIPGGPRTR